MMQNERHVKACRKPHNCEWCGEIINIGEPAIRVAGVWDGDFGSYYLHHECYEPLQNECERGDGYFDAYEGERGKNRDD